MTTIALTNNFHHTEATARVNPVLVNDDVVDPFYVVVLSASQMRRVHRKLCGMKDCTCGGIRGRQQHEGKRMNIRVEDPKLGVYYV